MYLRSLTLCFLIPIFLFCKTNKKVHETFSDSEGWHYKKNEKGEDEKFFAIGGWSVPGYTPNQNDISDTANAAIFRKQARNLNILITNHHYFKNYMSENDRIMMTITLFQFVRGYLNKIPHLSNKGLENGYYRSQYLKDAVNHREFVQALDEDIKKSINERFSNVELAYTPIDEVALGLAGNQWYVPPAVGDKIYERIKAFNPDPIVFVDLAGHGKGSSFFFEKRYLKEHDSMPSDPPYVIVKDKSAREYARKAIKSGEGFPLIIFNEGYDGVPGYKFKNNKYSYNSFTLEELKSAHYENIKQYAEAYKGNGNVFGINAFRDFHAHPILAGLTVDAIRAGLGDSNIPIWLYFDGNGYAKTKGTSVDEYIKELKCQMYTSIIHGATGVFFWNDMTKTPEVWNALQPILKEMKDYLDIIKLTTIDKRINDDTHIVIKENTNGQKYIIATNTSKTNVVALKQANVEKKMLLPLEVYISVF